MIHDFEGLRKKLEECIELNGLNSEQTRKISEKYNDLDNQENGFNIAKKIRNNDKLSEIIFIGNYNKDYINNFLISSIKAFAYIDEWDLNSKNKMYKFDIFFLIHFTLFL